MNPSTEFVWKEFRTRLAAFIASRLSDPVAAEDVLQNVFLKVHAGIAKLENPARLESWLFNVTRNAINDYYRRSRGMGPLPEELYSIEESGGDISGQLHDSLRNMVLLLPEIYREALLLSDFQGMSQQDAATLLGLSYSTLKSRVQRGRQLLRDMWQECCHVEFDRRGTIIDYHPLQCACCDSDKKAH